MIIDDRRKYCSPLWEAIQQLRFFGDAHSERGGGIIKILTSRSSTIDDDDHDLDGVVC